MKCESCGTARPLIVHHRDRNRANNAIENLCPNCHYREHGWGMKGDPLSNYSRTGTWVWQVTVPEVIWPDLVETGRLAAIVRKEIDRAYWHQGFVKRLGRWVRPKAQLQSRSDGDG